MTITHAEMERQAEELTAAWTEAIRGHRPVKLTTDLTRYGPGLVVGAQGYITQMHGSYGDRFCMVRFDNGVRLQVLYSSLAPVRDGK